MIIFKSISWKNFLSTGNVENKVDLNSHSTTLVVGKNGEGKSTMLDALTFVLFNKPFRDINRPQLVNSINQKNCEVTLEFSIGPANYKVVRGIKPAVFDIYLNDELINQDAAAKDYQKVLEQQILKLNYKTFTQVVILGSASFVPFMQLPTGQRREVIEDILDIRVFSVMNSILKERMVETKTEIDTIETSLRIITEKAKAQQKIIESLQNSKDESINKVKELIQKNLDEITDKQHLVDLIQKDIEDLNVELHSLDHVDKDIETCKSNMSKLQQKMTHADEHLQFFNSHDECPSCEQSIVHEHKEQIISKISHEKQTVNNGLSTLNSAYTKLSNDLTKKNDILKQIQDKNINMSTEITAMNMLLRQNTNHETSIGLMSVEQTDVTVEKDRLKELATEAVTINNNKIELTKEKNLQEIASILLRDTGIKTSIIKEYLPAMNKLINMYLSAMDFFVNFELDESFNEKIRARFRDEFTYASFSEGEKMRIDLAILFTWRQIAKMKNSVNTNLLILDEIFDSSLDVAGTDYFLSVMDQMGENSNIFVISHKGDVLLDKFKNNIRFEKHNDFSTIVQNS
jgi:DNA repair exonuclease SbcCD ATPase subunit